LRGANFAEGDGPFLGGADDSGGSSALGEIRDLGGGEDFGDASGFAVADGLGGAGGGVVTFGGMEGTTAGVGLVATDGNVVVVVVVLIHENEPFARSASMAAAVITSPCLKPPSDFVAGSVAVGA
jgi:hypothetical protein